MSDTTRLIAQLNTSIMPLDRGAYFEDPLDAALKARGMGEVTGGGTMTTPDGGIAYVDIEISVPHLSDSVVNDVASLLEQLGAPKGSFLHKGDGESLRAFGQAEILAVPLDGVELPADAYEGFDPEAFVTQCEKLIGQHGAYCGDHKGQRYTTFFFAGPSYAAMERCLADLVASHPICANTQLTRRA